MAFDPIPTALFSGMSEDGTDLLIPIASIPELTAAEADAVSGDSRKVCYAFLKRMAAWYTSLAVADRPANLIINEGNAVENSSSEFTKSFNIQFTLSAPSALDVATEP